MTTKGNNQNIHYNMLFRWCLYYLIWTTVLVVSTIRLNALNKSNQYQKPKNDVWILKKIVCFGWKYPKMMFLIAIFFCRNHTFGQNAYNRAKCVKFGGMVQNSSKMRFWTLKEIVSLVLAENAKMNEIMFLVIFSSEKIRYLAHNAHNGGKTGKIQKNHLK